MKMPDFTPLYRFATYPAAALQAQSGANAGDPVGLGAAAIPGDIYRLTRNAQTVQLHICDIPGLGQVVADGSPLGTPGDGLAIVDCHSFMGPAGETVEVLMLRRTDRSDDTTLHLLPLSPIRPGVEYELIGSSPSLAPERFADIVSVSFFAGTHITMAGGAQMPVEQLQPGDMVLTLDHGPRPIRWIGHQTRRATGAAAPIRITQGTLHTARDLLLSPEHRLFIWQRRDRLGTGRAEVLVKAALLVNGTTVRRDEGGHIDSYQILFDGREIIFAEGIAVESLLVTEDLRDRLPADLSLQDIAAERRAVAPLEVDAKSLGDHRDAADRLTRASLGRDD
jgi:hypothetical protein